MASADLTCDHLAIKSYRDTEQLIYSGSRQSVQRETGTGPQFLPPYLMFTMFVALCTGPIADGQSVTGIWKYDPLQVTSVALIAHRRSMLEPMEVYQLGILV